jgi:hypothetical protein
MEMFALQGNPKAGLAYAWSLETDSVGRNSVAVFDVGPIKSASHTVRAPWLPKRIRGVTDHDR